MITKTVSLLKLTGCTIVAAALLTACGKHEEQKPAAADSKAAPGVASELQQGATAVAEQVQDAARKAAATVQTQAAAAAQAAQSQFQTVIDQVKGLMAEKKYNEALQVIQQKIAGLKLTPEQQKLIDGLKEQIQKALASSAVNDASKTVGDLNKALGK